MARCMKRHRIAHFIRFLNVHRGGAPKEKKDDPCPIADN